MNNDNKLIEIILRWRLRYRGEVEDESSDRLTYRHIHFLHLSESLKFQERRFLSEAADGVAFNQDYAILTFRTPTLFQTTRALNV